ncbi:hypothetical protein [Moorena producens]|uniref:hypothetical protein n=1 Tax=Moorena producens TaxID=1155739 RepID=UPI003C772E10
MSIYIYSKSRWVDIPEDLLANLKGIEPLSFGHGGRVDLWSRCANGWLRGIIP